jgi:hypothetical protein
MTMDKGSKQCRADVLAALKAEQKRTRSDQVRRSCVEIVAHMEAGGVIFIDIAPSLQVRLD